MLRTRMLSIGIIRVISALSLVGSLVGIGKVWAQDVYELQKGEVTVKQRASAVEGVVILKLKKEGTGKAGESVLEEIAARINGSGIRQLFPRADAFAPKSGIGAESFSSLADVYEMQYDSPLAPHAAAALLMQDGRVEYAEPRYKYALANRMGLTPTEMQGPVGEAQPLLVPNDPQFEQMSHLQQVSIPEAWEVVKSSDGDVVLGIVDGGVDWPHTDLLDNLWQNPLETPNGIDDDGNGFVDDLNGWNFANNTDDPRGLVRTPENGAHGTIVAGIASAVTDNGRGIAGASWNASFMPINAGCPFTDSAVCYGYEGILYAALMGADVINVSWGGPDSFLGREFVRRAQEAGALLVVSAGNNEDLEGQGKNIDGLPSYPAAYEGVLVVGSTEKNSDIKATFSNFGLSVDVFAPGLNLNSTLPDDDYTTAASGTSFSTPIVVGLAALVRTLYPEWTVDQVREQIRATSDNIDDVNDESFRGLLGRGRVNAIRALSDTGMPSIRIRQVTFTDSGKDGTIQEGETVDVSLKLINFLADASGITFSVTSEDPLATLIDNTQSLGVIPSGQEVITGFSFRVADQVPDDYPIRFRAHFEGEGYAAAELVELTVNRITHDTGVIQMSLTDEGNIGWSGFEDTSEGRGFVYFGLNWLFEGGILVALGENNILDSVRNEEPLKQDEDFERVEGSTFGILEGRVTTEDGLVILTEKGAAEQGGLKIQQESYADVRNENSNFIIVRYILSQTDLSAGTTDDVYVGLFCDWDLTTGGDYARFDEVQRMGIVQPTAEDPILLFSTKLLTSDAGMSYRSISNSEIFDSQFGGDGFTESEKWAFLSEGIQVESVDDDDVSTLIAAGPYQLRPGQDIDVAFALIAASSSENLNRYAGNAQKLWDQTLQGLNPNPVSVDDEVDRSTFSAVPPFPNPVSDQAFFRFTLPEAGAVQLTLYDVLGRKVKTLIDRSLPSGVHTIEWDKRNQQGNTVSKGAYFYRIVASTPGRTYTATRKLVVIR